MVIGKQALHLCRLVASLALALAALSATPTPNTQARHFSSSNLLVRLAGGTNINALAAKYDLTVLHQVGGGSTYLVSAKSASQAQSQLRSDTGVTWVEPDSVGYLPEAAEDDGGGEPFAVLVDPAGSQGKYANQWLVSLLQLPAAQQASNRGAVTVAVIDTSVDVNHPALSGKVLNGADFVSGDPTLANSGSAEAGHGTLVAALVTLVAPSARILPVRALNDDGVGSVASVSNALYYAANNGAQVINLSLRMASSSTTMADAVQYARQKGATIVAAMGNQASNTTSYPALYPGVAAVAATDQNDVKAPFSNYGPQVNLAAPGVSVYSAYPGGRWATVSGTSFSAAVVAGAAALVAARGQAGKNSSGATSLAVLDNTAVDISAQNPGVQLGHGRVSPAAAVGVPSAQHGQARTR